MDSPNLPLNDFRIILKEELAARCRQNPRYSLRAFARDLKLAPSRLSEIISGKQGLSRKVAENISTILGYNQQERERFCDLVESMHARSRKEREVAKVRLKKHQMPSGDFQLQIDVFKAIADWYHFGILELMNIQGFKSETKWIAKKLAISEFEAQLAIDRLARLELIKFSGNKIIPTHSQGHVAGDLPSDGLKKLHSQLLAKAQEAIFLQSLEQREYRSAIMAIDTKMVAQAKKAIREFEYKFCMDVEEAKNKDGVYCLAIQFFDLLERG